jgi:hypothetical protein
MPWKINIDIANYGGTYNLSVVGTDKHIAFDVPGSRSFELEPGRYNIWLAGGTNFFFNLGADGKLSSETAGLVCDNDTVRFNITRVHVVPGAYKGTYWIGGYHRNRAASGPEWFVVLLEGRYSLIVASGNAFVFFVDKSGDVSVDPANANAAKGHGHSLQFNHCAIRVEPENYSGEWTIPGVEQRPSPGARSVVLMPHVANYILEVRSGFNARFDVDGNGAPSPRVEISDSPNTWRFVLLS